LPRRYAAPPDRARHPEGRTKRKPCPSPTQVLASVDRESLKDNNSALLGALASLNKEIAINSLAAQPRDSRATVQLFLSLDRSFIGRYGRFAAEAIEAPARVRYRLALKAIFNNSRKLAVI
jgi:hypothetical protein